MLSRVASSRSLDNEPAALALCARPAYQAPSLLRHARQLSGGDTPRKAPLSPQLEIFSFEGIEAEATSLRRPDSVDKIADPSHPLGTRRRWHRPNQWSALTHTSPRDCWLYARYFPFGIQDLSTNFGSRSSWILWGVKPCLPHKRNGNLESQRCMQALAFV